ncbi:MAG: hypothetical protein NZ851_00945 [Aquificaceae bacterium]|nr:hypothetical protein [Aquificaceae bacterium]
MAQMADIRDLQLLVRHEIGTSKRLKRELNLVEHIPAVDNFSLLLMYSDHLSDSHLRSISASMRESDIVMPKGNYIMCLLPGTDKEGAIHLAEGIKDFLGEEGYYVAVTYPEDGDTYEKLMDSLKLYLENKGATLPFT